MLWGEEEGLHQVSCGKTVTTWPDQPRLDRGQVLLHQPFTLLVALGWRKRSWELWNWIEEDWQSLNIAGDSGKSHLIFWWIEPVNKVYCSSGTRVVLQEKSGRRFRWLAEHGEVSSLQNSEVWKGVGLDHPFDIELRAGVQSFELRGAVHK